MDYSSDFSEESIGNYIFNNHDEGYWTGCVTDSSVESVSSNLTESFAEEDSHTQFISPCLLIEDSHNQGPSPSLLIEDSRISSGTGSENESEDCLDYNSDNHVNSSFLYSSDDETSFEISGISPFEADDDNCVWPSPSSPKESDKND